MTILSTNDVEQGYDYSLVLDTSTATTSSNYDEDFKLQLIKELSNLKRNAMAAPFEQAFNRYDELLKNMLMLILIQKKFNKNYLMNQYQ